MDNRASATPPETPTPLVLSAVYEFPIPTETPPLSDSSFDEDRRAPGTSPTPLTVTGDIRPPVLIHKVEPEYPLAARKARMAGVVIVEAVITEQGDVQDARVVRSINPLLDASSLQAVKMWRYRPALLKGRPVRVYVTVTMTFNLN